MKRILLLIIAASVLGCSINRDSNHYESLMKAYKEHNYFKLNSLMSAIKFDNCNPELLLYKAKLNYVFNNPVNSNNYIGRILNKYKTAFNDAILADLIEMRSNNYFRLQDYGNAVEDIKHLVKNYTHVLDSLKIVSLKEDILVRKAITGIPEMTITKEEKKDIILPIKRDVAGLINIPVKLNNDSLDFIFDTGANISVISKSVAKNNNIEILPDKAIVNSLAGIKIECELGYCDINLDEITIESGLFLIMEDSLLSFGNGYYVIKGIIGFPIINALKEIVIKNDSILTIPGIPQNCETNNFALDNLNPTILVVYNNDSLPFHFDTGADKTLLFSSFFKRYEKTIAKNYPFIDSQISGAGGSVNARVYVIDSISFTAGNVTSALDSLEIITEDLRLGHKYVYGNFGQDFIKQYSIMRMNFESMCISFY